MKGDGALVRIQPGAPTAQVERLKTMDVNKRHMHVLGLAQSRYGDGWQTALAHDLDCDARTVRRWVRDVDVPGNHMSLINALAIWAICTQQ